MLRLPRSYYHWIPISVLVEHVNTECPEAIRPHSKCERIIRLASYRFGDGAGLSHFEQMR